MSAGPKMIARDIDDGALALLPGCTFADRFAIDVPGAAIDAREAAERVFARQPPWIEALTRLRNALVAPFGLKRGARAKGAGQIGIFPVVSQTPGRVVLGFDDGHLNFRVVVDATQNAGTGTMVSATTLVAPHNAFGRFYLALVMPFHRIIVPASLKGALRPLATP